ncbi:VOC family protein [Chelativorans sp.]|uniref:VOC family protein n=1 Tax=Chelativorans sp. TaxID=2203393 RepID=UPI002811FE26|nr:VOC family protein [Chelativorans sp.]
MSGVFSGVYQIAYVTTDLDYALKVFTNDYDVPRWKVLGEVSLALDDGGSTRIRLALTFVGPLQLEIIEPLGGEDALYREALPPEGFGLKWHHVGFKVPSVEALAEIREKVAARGDPYVIGGGDPKSAKFFYADARHRLGHFLEYIYLSPERQELHASFPRN